MAYNNYFPMNYQQYFPQMQPAMPSVQQNPNTNIIWCQGIEAAKAYHVAPNTTVQLWDSEAQVIYLKSADASGMPSMKVIDYTVRDTQNAQNASLTSQTNYVTQEEIKALYDRVDALRDEVDSLTAKKTKKKECDEV